MTTTSDAYVPAAGKPWLLPFYDPFVALFSRERRWRGEILAALDLRPGDVLVDVGCGTGTLAVMAKQRAPEVEVIGIDPDPPALARARGKAARTGVAARFERGFGPDVARIIGPERATKTVSSFAFHHMPRDVQLATIAAMREVLKPGGALVIADFVGGHWNGPAEASLVADLSAQGFENARVVGSFRAVFARATLVRAEKRAG